MLCHFIIPLEKYTFSLFSNIITEFNVFFVFSLVAKLYKIFSHQYTLITLRYIFFDQSTISA